MSFTLGLFQLLLLEQFLPSLIFILDQGLELSRQFPSEFQSLDHFLVLGDGRLLVLVQLLAAVEVSAVAIEFGL